MRRDESGVVLTNPDETFFIVFLRCDPGSRSYRTSSHLDDEIIF